MYIHLQLHVRIYINQVSARSMENRNANTKETNGKKQQ